MSKVSIELDVEDVQEVLTTVETVVGKIFWVLENNPPKQSEKLQLLNLRLLQLQRASLKFRSALNERAKANGEKNVA
jgi:hypothetical protein